MDPAFNSIYRQQFGFYQQAFGQLARDSELREAFERSFRLIDEVLENEVGRSEIPLRSDARLFLMINLHQMVAIPLCHPESPTEVSAQLRTNLGEDVSQILRSAAEHATGRRELAASHILWGIADVLDGLHLKSFRLWERD